MKKFSILALSATVAIAPAFAETTANYNTPSVDTQTVVLPQTTVSTTTPRADLSFAFDDVENLQATDMTLAEMQETEGAVLPLVAVTLVGGAGSAWLNHGMSYVQTGQSASVKSTLVATGTGMVSKGYTTAMLKGVGNANKVTTTVVKGNAYAISQGTVGVYDKGKK